MADKPKTAAELLHSLRSVKSREEMATQALRMRAIAEANDLLNDRLNLMLRAWIQATGVHPTKAEIVWQYGKDKVSVFVRERI